jgi:hypothetical protein
MKLSRAIKTLERRKAHLLKRSERTDHNLSYDKSEAAAIICVLDRIKKDRE